jgi:Ser/Thr protein kinase RdoA (MazF antagonist)
MAPSEISTAEINTVSQAETLAAEALLATAWGEHVTVRAAEPILEHDHVFRLRVTTDRSVVLKKRIDGQDEGYGAEVAALEYLNGMPVPVAPRLLGADAEAGIMVLEDLGPGASLADSLLTGDPSRVRADLVSYAQALGAMHAWSMSRPGSPSLRGLSTPAWLGAVARGKADFLGAAAALGLASDRAAAEIDELFLILNEPGYHGLVHGALAADGHRGLPGAGPARGGSGYRARLVAAAGVTGAGRNG